MKMNIYKIQNENFTLQLSPILTVMLEIPAQKKQEEPSK